jgi:hypothetical protein
MMGGDEYDRDLRQCAGGGVGGGAGLQDAAIEATDGGIRVAKNVSGMRVDHAAVEGGLRGVRKIVYRSGGARGEVSGGLFWENR